MQDCSVSSANALEILQSFTKPLNYGERIFELMELYLPPNPTHQHPHPPFPHPLGALSDPHPGNPFRPNHPLVLSYSPFSDPPIVGHRPHCAKLMGLHFLPIPTNGEPPPQHAMLKCIMMFLFNACHQNECGIIVD